MQLRHIPDSSAIPAWLGWTLIAAVTIVGHALIAAAVFGLWQLLILASSSWQY